MGDVTKTVTENDGDVTKTTSYKFESLEDFLLWEERQASNQEENVDDEVVRRYRVIDNLTQHGFEIGEEVEVVSIDTDGYIQASNGEKGYWMTEEDLEEL